MTYCCLKPFSNLTVFNMVVKDSTLVGLREGGRREGESEFQKVYINVSNQRPSVSGAREMSEVGICAVLRDRVYSCDYAVSIQKGSYDKERTLVSLGLHL